MILGAADGKDKHNGIRMRKEENEGSSMIQNAYLIHSV